jgi:rsbT co-antagonist protein RsbR
MGTRGERERKKATGRQDLQGGAAQLEEALRRCREEEEALRRNESHYKALLNNLPQKVFLKDRDSRYLTCNENYARDLKIEPLGIEGKTDFDFYPRSLAEKYREDDRRVMASGRPEELEERYVADGRELVVNTVKAPVRNEEGQIIGVLGIFWDITERKRLEVTVRRQAQEILDISTPVMQVWEGVVVAPLIGTLDSQRTQRFMERLLNGIVDHGSSVALVDITGVPAIDTQTAQHLIETISAVRLLGADVVLTGVRPAIAQTLVHLGVDLSGITTRPSMKAGLQVALDRMGIRVSNKDSSLDS